MHRLAAEAAQEISALYESIGQAARERAMMAPPDSPARWRPSSSSLFGDESDVDGDESFSSLDVRQPLRNNGAPSYQARAVGVPLPMPIRRAARRGMRDRERDRAGGPMVEEMAGEDDDGGAMVIAAPPAPEPTISAERAEVLDKLGEGSGSANCFACKYVRNAHVTPIAAKGFDHIRTIMRSAGAGANKVALALEMADYFENKVRAASERWRHPDEDECPEWPAADIYDHFFTAKHNRVDAIGSQERRVLQAEQMQEELFHTGMWVMTTAPDGTQTRRLDTNNLQCWLKLNDTITRMYNQDPQKLKMGAIEAPNIAQQQPTGGRKTRLLGSGASIRF